MLANQVKPQNLKTVLDMVTKDIKANCLFLGWKGIIVPRLIRTSMLTVKTLMRACEKVLERVASKDSFSEFD